MHILWTVAEGRLHFEWNAYLENRVIVPPEHRGFGTRMIERAVERELSGRLHMDWQPDGLKARFSVPLEKLTARAVA